jgi:flagellin-like protein
MHKKGERDLNRKLMRSRKGISPILATLLLIVIAVAAIVVTYAWIMTYMTGATTQAGVRLNPENIRFFGTPTDADRNLIDFTVQNTGKTSTQIVKMYMGNSSGNLIDVTIYTDIGTGKPLQGEDRTTIRINWPNPVASIWEPQKTYYFTVVPAQGQSLTNIPEQAPYQ